ncbi:MAG: methionine--tRNA ligase [Deltaproteobacteria bacterium]|nr:methionine--tRNA ligase [Deltaproteobacteria bacterium]
MTERFYVTTPIYYINDVPHLGSAYTTIAADVLCRYQRLRGREARFLTGTDEHGLKIQRAAEERGTSPQALADEMSVKFREAWPLLGCAPDDFIRTSEARHARGVQALWRKIHAAGDIYLGHYQGLYCVGCEAYYTEKELDAGGLCPIHGTPAEAVEEESYFFRLSRYAERLLAFYDHNPSFVVPPSRMNEVRSFVRGGLQDLSISRTTFRWGVEVPDDPRHVMYVWFDALSNYHTALQEPEDNRRFWPASVHLVGKDILRFHAVYWPAFLMAAGFPDEALPRQVLAHGFLTYGGRKMSKSLRNTISPVALASALSPSVGVDALRYCLLRSVSFGQDGDFSVEDLLQRYASDLGNTLGNLVSRALPFTERVGERGTLGPLEEAMNAQLRESARAAAEAFDAHAPTRALEAIWAGLAAANHYVDRATPWVAKKQDPARLDTIVATLVEALDAFSVMIAPVMPQVATAMRAQLGLGPLRSEVGRDQWPFEPPRRAPGGELRRGKPIFPRLDDGQRALVLKAFAPPEESDGAAPAAAGAPAQAPAREVKPLVDYATFAKMELRVGTVVSAERIKRKDRLLSLRVDVGEPEPRSLVAGIGQDYSPPELVGRRIVVLCNLEPRQFAKGLDSHGMLLAAEDGGKVRLLGVDGEVAPGAAVR